MRNIVFVFAMLSFFGVREARADDIFGGFSAETGKIFEGGEVPWIPPASDIRFFGSYYSDGVKEGEIGLLGQYRLPSTPLSIGALFEASFLRWPFNRDNQYFLGPTLQLKFSDPRHWDVSLRVLPLFDVEDGDFGEVRTQVSFFVGEMTLSCQHHFEFIFRAHYIYFKEDGPPLETMEDDRGEWYLAQHEVSGEMEWSYHYKDFRYLEPLLLVGYRHLFSEEVLRAEVEPRDHPQIVRIWDTYYDQGILSLTGGLKSEIPLSRDRAIMLFARLRAGAQYIYSDPGDSFWRAMLFGDIGFWF